MIVIYLLQEDTPSFYRVRRGVLYKYPEGYPDTLWGSGPSLGYPDQILTESVTIFFAGFGLQASSLLLVPSPPGTVAAWLPEMRRMGKARARPVGLRPSPQALECRINSGWLGRQRKLPGSFLPPDAPTPPAFVGFVDFVDFVGFVGSLAPRSPPSFVGRKRPTRGYGDPQSPYTDRSPRPQSLTRGAGAGIGATCQRPAPVELPRDAGLRGAVPIGLPRRDGSEAGRRFGSRAVGPPTSGV